MAAQHMPYGQWLATHESQLVPCGLPRSLWPALHAKLVGQVFDAGTSFQFAFDDGEGGGVPVQPREQYTVFTTRPLACNEDVFLLDHAWTFDTLEAGERQLSSEPDVLARVADIVNARAALANGDNGDRTDDDGISLLDATLRELAWHTHAVQLQTTFDTDESDRGGTLSVRNESGPGATRMYYYVLDELGTRFGQVPAQQRPAFAFTVFCWAGSCFTLAWPVRDVQEGEEATRKAEQSVPWPGQGQAPQESKICIQTELRKGGSGLKRGFFNSPGPTTGASNLTLNDLD